MVQYAVFLLVIGHTPLTLLTMGPGIATLAQALVGLHTHSSVAAGWLTFGCSKGGKKQTQMSSCACSNCSIGVRGSYGAGEQVKAPTDSAEGSFPARAAAALSGGSAVSILTVPGTSRHQQLRRLHLTLALFGGVRPAAGVRRSQILNMTGKNIVGHTCTTKFIG